ncbi:MAG: hypothetical protein C0483_12170 [Pirellula sp.]|nr:hypothetical protein [Pirellula sp.]
MPLRLPTALTLLIFAAGARGADAYQDAPPFETNVAPILERRCLECHGAAGNADAPPKGKLSLATREATWKGGESGPAVVPSKPEESLLLDFVRHDADGKALMPKNREPLTKAEVATLEQWIAAGAAWPEGATLRDRRFEGYRWWSLEPPMRPQVPSIETALAMRNRNPIDAFILAKLQEQGLRPSVEASPPVLCRRLYFDLIGLPPKPEEIEAFVAASAARPEEAYAALVDKLLASPHYGERWARHWLDVVHFGETHGYDKDKPRPNAWPYRDYVIRAFNEDRPYDRFVKEQLAGDVLYPDTRDGLEALGFIAAGPWDFIGHAEVPESKTDGKIARHLDRDDMVANTMQTFNSLTVQCAQCHDHKFDPITQEDYYSLQAVFAALDRTEKPYDIDPDVARRRAALAAELADIAGRQTALDQRIAARAGDALTKLDSEIAAMARPAPEAKRKTDAFGYHSAISDRQDAAKWVQVDLAKAVPIAAVLLHPCRDNFNNIGDGFGFPVRYRVELANDAEFRKSVVVVADFTGRDVPNPGVQPQSIAVNGEPARYVRVTATKLAPRSKDYIFALAELTVVEAGDKPADGAKPTPSVSSLDSIEAAPRWRRVNLVDGYYPGEGVADAEQLAKLTKRRAEISIELATPDERDQSQELVRRKAATEQQQKALPPQQRCYVGAVHTGSGAFAGTGAQGGKPRAIYVLARGSVSQPGKEVEPGAVSSLRGLSARFTLPAGAAEGERRAALARWITDDKNPLTYRTIVNRVWQHHFGRGIVDTPNDFGRNGAKPTHPELLDWLAVEFRDGGKYLERQSLKSLHRLIVSSATYRQTSRAEHEGETSPMSVDSDNRLLWRANRRRLDAEALRDALLLLGGRLDRTMYGQSFQDFVIDKPQHSPHYEYHLHDPEDPKSHRRSIYRFIVRSQPQPFMTTFDCADPSMQVDRRNESLSPLQALALLNNNVTVTMAKHFAERLEARGGDKAAQIARGFFETTGRAASVDEQAALVAYARQHGIAATCRVLLNLNEFMFVE